ncbi:MAG TPA: glycosyl hydrolase 115 family protein [Saprospiraceae bacterium]|nr:glycosyl hydrolase 115 family protein [Saprospiraceae bacterium]
MYRGYRLCRAIQAFIMLIFLNPLFAQSWLSSESGFPLHQAGAIVIDPGDEALTLKTAELFRQDLEMVFGIHPEIISDADPARLAGIKNPVLLGTIAGSSLVKAWAAQQHINLESLQGKWETYLVSVVDQSGSGQKSLLLAGSDRRGMAFGAFELCKQMGVSPWYWWADVPVVKKEALYVKDKLLVTDAPKVKYRGIFINDEAPALSGWTREKFGGFNHLFYQKVFELILRLKGNYLWPAMWGNAFYDDDFMNRAYADLYGIVIGTSHHEPLMRAHDEWRRYGKRQKWNYDSTEAGLKEFWKGGMQRANHEKIVSIGMRGDGDEPMSRETATALLERIVRDQRQIIEEVTGKPAPETPQLWALYKEVQDYYDQGMRVPDDVTLLLCDDNWGNIRRLPKTGDAPRKGGYGIYYNFDYVGGPRNYKWVNTNPLPRVWEQMNLAWEYHARQIWIVNVGDIKPMELPISFFLDHAWNPEAFGPRDVQPYIENWYSAFFGARHAKEMADLTSAYLKINGRRKPELLDSRTNSLENYNEFQRVSDEYQDLLRRAEILNADLPASYRDAYFQLILHPVRACSNLYQLYLASAKNNWYAGRKSLLANEWADRVKQFYKTDSLITLEYHKLGNGKWNHMMSQTHIGYTYWQQPPRNRMPRVIYVDRDSAVSFEGKTPWTENAPPMTRQLKNKKHTEARDGVISLAADAYTRAIHAPGAQWTLLPDHGRTGNAMTTFPVMAADIALNKGSPHLRYRVRVRDTGTFTLYWYFSPTLNFHNDGGLKCAVSIDREAPQILDLNSEDHKVRTWEAWVANNIILKSSRHTISRKGKHTIKFWMMQPGPVLQKWVLDLGGMKASYLGPPE